MDRKRCAIVVPVYKKFKDLNENEKLSILNTVMVLSNYDIWFIGPDKIVEDYGKLGSQVHLSLEMMSYGQYNNLCKSAYFYGLFLEAGYSYMCLVQQDVWVLKDNLEYFLDEFDKDQLDYIGAPWAGVWFAPDGTVGNGGFCIRRLEKFRDICKDYPSCGGNEDVFFLKKHGDKIKFASTKLAAEFSWEEKPYFWYKLTDSKLPMGTHGYFGSPDRVSFWRHFIPVYETKCKAGEMDIYNNPEFEKKFRNE